MRTRYPLAIVLIVAVSFSGAFVGAHAASFESLKNSGHKVSSWTRNAAGKLGWKLTKGQSRHFCRLSASKAYVGSTGLVGFTSAGRQIKMSRKAWEQTQPKNDPRIPQLSALKSGTMSSRFVGRCNKI